ncbi:hypothetical protein Y032_0699g1626 [Ancylostoma ceylanicum]|uniref:Uncharacterized protein n=1 Tax=Ancylostoma ceylanicum TaxID=53326 RepID=A0A016WGG5_9BILA|nr:hypothetical protein Y032_0699g1626 [Ancylostoma ceylanicum]
METKMFCVHTVLVKKLDGLRVRFLGVAAAESRRDLLDPPTLSMLSPHPSFRFRRDGAVAQSVYLFEKDFNFMFIEWWRRFLLYIRQPLPNPLRALRMVV